VYLLRILPKHHQCFRFCYLQSILYILDIDETAMHARAFIKVFSSRGSSSRNILFITFWKVQLVNFKGDTVGEISISLLPSIKRSICAQSINLHKSLAHSRSSRYATRESRLSNYLGETLEIQIGIERVEKLPRTICSAVACRVLAKIIQNHESKPRPGIRQHHILPSTWCAYNFTF